MDLQRQARRQQRQHFIGVVETETAGDTQTFKCRLPAQQPRAITAQLAQEIPQRLVLRHQYTVTPARHFGVEQRDRPGAGSL
ncbi:hypothetical protein D3C81_2058840 [compost metagenome]